MGIGDFSEVDCSEEEHRENRNDSVCFAAKADSVVSKAV